jgi:hypothetical protein
VQSVLLALYFRNASQQGEAKTMGKTVRGFLGSSLIVASLIVALMASAVTAAEHHIRRHHPYISESYAAESARHAFGRYHHSPAFDPEYQNAFGTITPLEWTTGMQPDDWRQSVNGR